MTERTISLPGALQAVIQTVEQAVGHFFPDQTLHMGGGTVLQARWDHRLSSDIDLFCAPLPYRETLHASGAGLEQALLGVCDDPESTFVDAVAAYTMVQGTEVTILPTEPPLGVPAGQRIDGTQIETWSSADILASKLIHRICGGGIVELRDLYDLAAAAHHEPSALALAAGVIRSHQMKRIEVLLDLLPADWMSASDKPLLGLADDPFDFRPNAIKQLLLDYRAHAPTAPMATQEQTGNATHARS